MTSSIKINAQLDFQCLQLDIAIAEKVMEQVPCDKWGYINYGSGGGHGSVQGNCEHRDCYPSDPNLMHVQYSTNMDAAYAMEKKLEERGFAISYAMELTRLLVSPNLEAATVYIRTPKLFNVIHASPRDRCIAALRAVGVSLVWPKETK